MDNKNFKRRDSFFGWGPICPIAVLPNCYFAQLSFNPISICSIAVLPNFELPNCLHAQSIICPIDDLPNCVSAQLTICPTVVVMPNYQFLCTRSVCGLRYTLYPVYHQVVQIILPSMMILFTSSLLSLP